jgi:ADP-ribosylglycohydrolase
MKRFYNKYPAFFDFNVGSLWGSKYMELSDNLLRFSKLNPELGHVEENQAIVDELERAMLEAEKKLTALAANPVPDPDEPEDLVGIRAVRPKGPRRLSTDLPKDFHERFMGSILARGAGCTLGAGLEFQSIRDMENWAKYFDREYPLTDYWERIKNPFSPRYIVGIANELCRGQMDCIPVDDDTGYTLIGLLTLEENGPNFTRRQMADTWLKHFPLQDKNGSWGCFWGERKMVQNLLAGVPADQAGYLNNPNVQSVAAWTRADAWGYAAAGWPEKAAELAYKDASSNHRRNGVYATMFFSATIAAAFTVDDPVEAIKIGLTEIPENCEFAQAARWALDIAPQIRDFRDGAKAVRDKYPGMFEGHAINCGLFVILGLCIGKKDVTKTIGETVAMGMDNDCTGATSGSIAGAVVGKKNVPEHWYKPFKNRMRVYFKEQPDYIDLDDLEQRFEKQVKTIHSIST